MTHPPDIDPATPKPALERLLEAVNEAQTWGEVRHRRTCPQYPLGVRGADPCACYVACLRAAADEVRAEMAEGTLAGLDKRCADHLADEVDVLIARKLLDSRSPAADALLDYRDPPRTPRSEQIASNQQAAREALRPIAECGVTTERVKAMAKYHSTYHPEHGDALYALAAALDQALSKAFGSPEAPVGGVDVQTQQKGTGSV